MRHIGVEVETLHVHTHILADCREYNAVPVGFDREEFQGGCCDGACVV